MKHIKSFEQLNEARLGQKDKYPPREFDEITEPVEPFKRKLTEKETKFMFNFFINYSWSDPDANGNIILGGGEHAAGIYYITEEDLSNFMGEEKEEAESTDK